MKLFFLVKLLFVILLLESCQFKLQRNYQDFKLPAQAINITLNPVINNSLQTDLNKRLELDLIKYFKSYSIYSDVDYLANLALKVTINSVGYSNGGYDGVKDYYYSKIFIVNASYQLIDLRQNSTIIKQNSLSGSYQYYTYYDTAEQREMLNGYFTATSKLAKSIEDDINDNF